MEAGDIVSHHEICMREGRMLQHGMNFRVAPTHSVILMSLRKGAPYDDLVLDNGRTLVYEGHDVPRTRGVTNPKKLDQPEFTPSGRLTPNGKFAKAARDFLSGDRTAERVRVYEKIKAGIWVYFGDFDLVDINQIGSGRRKVFKFRLQLTPAPNSEAEPQSIHDVPAHSRLIPGSVKLAVYKRDKGCCVLCHGKDNLHFDHDLPYSKGGTSISAENIRLLCMRHNLQKRDRIE